MAWINQFTSVKPSPRDLDKLIAEQRTIEWNALTMFTTHLSIAVTISLAAIGSSIAAATNSGIPLICLAALLSTPIMVAGVRWFSLASLDRYYARFLEAVTVQKKFRYVIEKPAGIGMPFPQDATLETARHWDQLSNDDSSKWIAEYLEKGHNRVASLFFGWLFVLSFVPAVLAACRLWNWPMPQSGVEASRHPMLVFAFLDVAALAALIGYRKGTRWIRDERRKNFGDETPNKRLAADGASRRR